MAGENAAASAQDALLDQILNSRSFARIPRDALSKIVARIDMLPTCAGEAIIRQGEEGDSFYIIRAGRCRVTGHASMAEDAVELATLGPGDSFGEEALIRGTPRNATIEMLSDGYIARLNKEDFIELVKNTLLRKVTPDEARKMHDGGAEFIDVRSGGEFAHFSIQGSRNIPLDFLRKARRSLDAGKTHVTCSDQELEAAVAAFLLAQAGFETCYLGCSVGEYLSATGEFADERDGKFGEHGEHIIDLPEEYTRGERTKVAFEDKSLSVPPPASVATTSADTGSDIDKLRVEFNTALVALREEFTTLLDGSSKFIIQKMMEKMRALEAKIDQPRDS